MLGAPTARREGARPDPRLGFRRVDLVRVWTGRDGSRYEVDGVVHRYPVTRQVSAAVAARLVAAGAPLVVRQRPDAEEQAC